MKYGNMVYIVSDGKVLMIQKGKRENDPNSGYYTFPGGKLEDFEKGLVYPMGRLESAVREPKEETTGVRNLGIIVKNPVLRGVILFDNQGRTFTDWKNPTDFLVYIYAVTRFQGEAEISNEGIPHWVPLDRLSELPSNPGDKVMYQWLGDGRRFVGVIKHNGNEIDEAGTFVDYFD